MHGPDAQPKKPRLGPRRGAASILAALVCAEVSLRAAGFGAALVFNGHDTRGWVMAPNQEADFMGHRVRVGDRGFADDPLPAAGEPDLVVALGSSRTMGLGVAEEDRWTELLESAWGRRVVNLGVPAYGMQQLVATYDEVAAPLRPSLVLLEVSSVSPVPMSRRVVHTKLGTWFAGTALHEAWRELVVRRGSVDAIDGGGASRDALIAKLRNGEVDAAVEAAWGQVRSGIERIALRQSEHGGHVVLVVMPEIEDWTRPDGAAHKRELAAWASAEGYDVVSAEREFTEQLTPWLAGASEQGETAADAWEAICQGGASPVEVPFLPERAAHWSERGHDLVAARVTAAER